MQVFAIFDVSQPAPLKAKLAEKYPGDYYQSGGNTFFVATSGKTTRQIAEEVGFDTTEDGRAVIMLVSAYWGVHSPDLWEWLKAKMSQNGT